ncbi:pitrilysin family protein [Rhodoferax sp.]|uniref:M16 family metallopeptidase n=1 Tax=Rhodoferax sp. TaxID=50421 RepID=UPI002628F07A|nr:pitrilysin family protein [Rhodoferax sp.]MDD2918468.1 pitrilysin family protein [Rhodoferax sp.]
MAAVVDTELSHATFDFLDKLHSLTGCKGQLVCDKVPHLSLLGDIMRRCIWLVGILFLTMTAHAAAVVDGFAHVRTVGAIDEYTLKANGLQVLLLPEHSSPTLTFMVTYRVGSKNEVTGTTGATHLLEHLMFKGTTQRDRSKGNNVDQMLERTGARYNATTWLDRTNYYENLASEHLASVADMEADRMRNLLLREEDRQPEMTVVRNEFERGENSPIQSLYKEIYQSAFVAHPYHHSTIGHRSDIEKVSIEKLREFYNTYYWPDNATVSIIGDFQPAQALEIVKKTFGALPHSPRAIPSVYTEEPAQTGARRVTVKRAGQLGVVAIAHKIPAATHPDYAAVSLLSAILADGKNSRLYKAVTDKNLSTGVEADTGFNSDPSLHIIFAPLAPGAKHADIENAIVQEVERLKRDGVTEGELKAAIAKTLADSAFKRDGSFAVAGNLNECIAAGDWSLFYALDNATEKVTVADIVRVARSYLNEDQSVVGWFVPTVAGGAAVPGATKSNLFPAGGPSYYRSPGIDTPGVTAASAEAAGGVVAGAIAPKVRRSKITGIDVIAYPTGVKNVFTLRASLPAGRARAGTGNPSIPMLTGMLLDQGTLKQDKFSIAEKLEAVGASINFGVGIDLLEISAKSLKKDAPLLLSLIAEQLRAPAFSEDEFAKAKKQYAGALQRRLESTDFRAADAFTRAVYADGHPSRNPGTDELLAAVESARLEDVKAFHKANYGPEHMTLVMTGDLDMSTLQAAVEQSFSGWSGGVSAVKNSKLEIVQAPQDQVVVMADKTSVSVVLGQVSGLRYNDPDYQALRLATAIFGSGFTGRLMANVRDKEGLTYDVSAYLANDMFRAGDWKISASFSPAMLEKGIASTRRQLELWFDAGVTSDEIASRKTNLIGSFKVNLATTGGMADALLAAVNRGYDVGWLDDFPVKINAIKDEQVNGAIKKYLKPNQMVLIKAGTLPVSSQQ